MKRGMRFIGVLTALAIVMTTTLVRPARMAAGLPAATGAKVDPLLTSFLSAKAPGTRTPVVISYSHQPNAGDFSRLQSAGIMKGYVCQQLPMVIADMNIAQLAQVRLQSGVKSIWANRMMKSFTNAARPFIGVNAMSADREITSHNTNNPGIPVTGLGIGIGYVDTGVDATSKDLPFGTKVRQNVIQPLAQGVVGVGELGLPVGVDISDQIGGPDGRAQFVQVPYLENQQMSDVESGHGTFGSGVAAGLGVNSGGFYGGVARGAHLVVVNSGTDSGLPLVAIIGAYDYLLVHQYDYNIRVINNSWGGSLADSELLPDNPINLATRTAHDRNITVVFAAGNAGTKADAINPYSTMAWTISVAAGEKQGFGTPASFSSRGVNNGSNPDVAGMPADPNALPNLRPDITGSGVDIKSVRSHGPGLTNIAGTLPVFVGSNDLTTIPPAYLPFYTTSQGTSFSCPQVSGVVALMLEANPQLTPDEVVTLLRQTATPMPYEQKVVGSGYVDAHNVVRAVMGLTLVAHPANLFPPPAGSGGPQIIDPAGDQFGTDAQDILSADYKYDAVNNQIVYTMTLTSMSTTAPNMHWIQELNFKDPSNPAAATTLLYVTTAIDDPTGPVFFYGTIANANGVNTQTDLGAADSGEIRGNQIIVRLSVDKVNAAVGYNVVGTTATGSQAIAQIVVGALGSGLLFPADVGTGSDFVVGN
jgi:serine protease AprX